MIKAWIVTRKERHLDNKTWVCMDKEDALYIAREITVWWLEEYGEYGSCLAQVDVDEELYGDLIYNYSAEDCFSVHVAPQEIREAGEAAIGEEEEL